MKKILIIAAAVLTLTNTQAQDFKNYEPLRNSGDLPADFTTPSSVKYKKDIAKLGKEKDKKAKAIKDNFYLESNFAIDGMIRSGRILMEKEYAAYLKEIVDMILKDDPELAKQTRVYITRSPIVNAVATSTGAIFVNWGLLARVENEAQLAFILAHELIHLKKKHSLKFVLKAIEVEKKKRSGGSYNYRNEENKELERHAFSREQETEADTEGFALFEKTGYSYESIRDVFNILNHAELPFSNAPFDRNFLNLSMVQLPKTYFLDSIKAIDNTLEDEDDSESTHPNLKKRVEKLDEFLTGKSSAGRSAFLVSESRFAKLQKVARFELPQMYLHRHLYQEAIYNTYLLTLSEKDSKYLDKAVAKALYGLVKYRNNENEEALAEMIKEDSIKGEIRQIYHLLDTLTKGELNLLAVGHAKAMTEKYKDDKEMKNIYDDLVWELTQNFENAEALTTAIKVKVKAKKKVSKLKKKSKKTDSEDTEKTEEKPKEEDNAPKEIEKNWFLPLSDSLLKDEAFKNLFEKYAKQRKTNKDNEEEYQEERKKAQETKYKKGHKLGINKIVVVAPMHAKLQNFGRLDYLETEESKTNMRAEIAKSAKSLGLSATILSDEQMKGGDTEKFNDLIALNEWFGEQGEAGRMSIYPHNQAEVERIAAKYGTDKFLWIGALGVKGVKEFYYFAILYDVKQGKNEIIKMEVFNHKPSQWLIDMHTYDALNQIKHK